MNIPEDTTTFPNNVIFMLKTRIEAMPEGENVGSYLDEINYAADELHRRKARPCCPTCGHAR